jgi:hypothetical protein
MNFQSDSGAKTNAGLDYPTRRPEAGPQLRPNIRPISPPGGFGSLREHSPMMPVDSPGEETAQEAIEQSKNFLKRAEAAKAKLANARGSKKTNLNLGWLGREPAEWVGKKIRHRLNGKVFLVRTVFPNGRVELEKSWMMYLSFVWTVRAEYETFSA